ncbi:unnamed protein product [Bursaphelenchus okinawaensis]|uniref:Uncharacterized protein n=1 Tax=Bursaphelenchus okinawaensis TaxID=465554 RepID=A0A811LQN4_9BILA|nr:unnamed protein product [Bursaphelenchus okinawaensis]CAG9127369.1 unnamed protein product [Bursaphelenchus okinawaensis]
MKQRLSRLSTDAVELAKKRLHTVFCTKPKIAIESEPSTSEVSSLSSDIDNTSPYFVKDYSKPLHHTKQCKLNKEQLVMEKVPSKITTEFWVVTFYGRCIFIRLETSVYDLHTMLVGT